MFSETSLDEKVKPRGEIWGAGPADIGLGSPRNLQSGIIVGWGGVMLGKAYF